MLQHNIVHSIQPKNKG